MGYGGIGFVGPLPYKTASHVFFLRHWFKMIGVDATSNAAQVIYL
jgi:hypothetical protein